MFGAASFIGLHPWLVAGAAVALLVQLALIVGLLVHRSRRRRAESEARTNAERYRSVVETQHDLVCRFLPDSTLTFVNDAYCRFWNKTREELIGTRFVDLIPEESRADVLTRLATLTSGTQTYEHPVTLRDGSIGWQHWVDYVIVDAQGHVVELQGVGHDVTDRRRAEEALRQAEARNSAILRAIPDLMFVLLPDGTYVDYYARDPRLLFVPPDEFLGKKAMDIMPPEISGALTEALARASRTDEPVVLEYALPMGDERFYEARIVKAGGDRLLTIVRDVTESRRASELNRDLAQRLIASQENERQRIARELHDDVSQRLALLNIELDQLAGHAESERSRVRLRKLSTFAGEIASDLHNLSYELHPSKLQAIGFVPAIQALCRDAARQRDLRVTFTHRAIPATIDANVSLCLYRIVQEALHNVARHSRSGDAEVSLTYDDGHIALQISDSGVGFNPKHLPYPGLGLVSMQERVAAVKGQLAIHAFPGGGTRIAVRIPAPAAPTSPATAAAGSDAPAGPEQAPPA